MLNENMKCKECEKKKRPWMSLKGDGWCEVHKGKFFFSQKGQICPICAKENNQCTDCGKVLLENETRPVRRILPDC
jgi:hypothetical protein